MKVEMKRMAKKVKTMEEVFSSALTKLDTDLHTIQAEKDAALGIFRQTATNLANINQRLGTTVDNIENLIDYAQRSKDDVTKMMTDNEAVRAKIIEIIGE